MNEIGREGDSHLQVNIFLQTDFSSLPSSMTELETSQGGWSWRWCHFDNFHVSDIYYYI